MVLKLLSEERLQSLLTRVETDTCTNIEITDNFKELPYLANVETKNKNIVGHAPHRTVVASKSAHDHVNSGLVT